MRLFLLMIYIAIGAFAIDYRSFEAEALKSSPLLKSAKLESETAAYKGALALRYENPYIEGELSSFDPKDGAKESGWRIGLSQEFRTFGLRSDLENYAEALKRYAKADYEKLRSAAVAILRTKYTEYVKERKRELLIKEEIALAKRLESIAKERFKSGAGTKSKVMQASLQKIAAETKLLKQRARVVKSYYALLETAALKESNLEASFIYSVESEAADPQPNNPELEGAIAKRRLLEAEAKREQRSIKGYRLFTEYENEPDQSAIRIGVETAIPIFNSNLEEMRIAQIKAKQSAFKEELLKKRQSLELEALQKRISLTADRLLALKKRLEKSKELLKLFEEGYRTSQSSLLDLIDTKNSLIETKLEILNTEYLANIDLIRLNYLKGDLK